MPNGFSFALRFADGTPLRIDSLADGVVLRSEFDAFPRPVRLMFTAADPVTKKRMNDVRRDNGWEKHEFQLVPFTSSTGTLGFKGVTPDSLPSGLYSVRLAIEDLKISKTPRKVRIANDDTTTLELVVSEDSRRVELKKKVEDFDAEIARVLTHSKSRLDGMAVKDWLTDDSRRARRKACLLNLLAKIRALDIKHNTKLMQALEYVFFADVDRVYVSAKAALASKMPNVFKKDAIIHPTHLRLMQAASKKNPGTTFGALESFREQSNPGMQVVCCEAGANGTHCCYADMDIDLGTPSVDFIGFIIHIGELADPRRTDHLKLWKKLSDNTDIAPFLHYAVVK